MARSPFPWPAVNHFSTAFTRHSTALLLSLVPSSILPSIVDLPSQYNGEYCLFFTCDLPSNQFIVPFHHFIPSSDARCSTSPTTSPTTPPHPLWSTMHTAMHTYMVSVLPSVASSPLYGPLPFFPPTVTPLVQILTHPSHTQKRPSPPSHTGSYPGSGAASPFHHHWHHPTTPGSGGSGSEHETPLSSPQPHSHSSPVMPLYHPHFPQPPYQHAHHQPTSAPHPHLNSHHQFNGHVHAHPQPQSHAHAHANGPSRLIFTVRSHPRHMP